MIRIILTLIITVGVVALCFLTLTQTSHIWFINQARRRGLYPPRGEASIKDVKELLLKGERVLAIHVYRELYGISFKQAELEVDLLERNLEVHE